MNQSYLETLRSNSCYPTFRGFVAVVTVLGYVASGFILLACLLSLILRPGEGIAGIMGIIVGVLLALVVRASKEVSLMIADIADATLDFASRQTTKP